MQIPQTNIIRFKALSYSILLAALVWYSYWITYDIIAWNKSLIQVNPLNYFGATVIVGLMVFEARIRSCPQFKKNPQRGEMEPQMMALQLRINECPFGVDYFDEAERPETIPRKCIKCSNIIDCACRSSQNYQ